MSENPNLPRVYGEEEIGRILKRATELQIQEPAAPGTAGVTLDELEDIAAEAGIDPRFLRRAAWELDTSTAGSTFWSKIVGDDLMLVREVTLPGELADDGFERIVGVIQAGSREHGQPSLLGRTLTWRAETQSKSRTVQIVISSRDGTTHVRMEENLTQMAAGIFGGSTAGFGVGVGIGVGLPIGIELLGSALFATVAPIGTVALGFIGARVIYRQIAARRRKAVNELFDRTVAEAEASIAAAGSGRGGPARTLPAGG
jgi:hypothetical protein